jgi:hypothetical protein
MTPLRKAQPAGQGSLTLLNLFLRIQPGFMDSYVLSRRQPDSFSVVQELMKLTLRRFYAMLLAKRCAPGNLVRG